MSEIRSSRKAVGQKEIEETYRRTVIQVTNTQMVKSNHRNGYALSRVQAAGKIVHEGEANEAKGDRQIDIETNLTN